MATETIDIRIREDGARVVNRNLQEIGSTAEQSAGGVDILKKALGALGTVLAVNRLRQYADTWTDLNSRVKLATGSQEAAVEVMGRLTTMARRTYSGLEATAESYLGNATALKELGLSTAESLDYVEALNNALVVSGAKAERAASVTDALSKAMMLGTLSGNNLNTVISTGGRVAELLAAELGTTTNNLLRLGRDGQITGEVIRTALVGNLELLREEADAMPATIGDAMVLLENGLLSAIGKFDEMTGASSALAGMLIVVADNMDLITAALLSMAVAAAVAFVPAPVLKFTAAIKALWLVLAMNPFIAIAAVIATLIAFVVLYGDEINAGIDATTSLKDVLRAFIEEGIILWNDIAEAASGFFSGLMEIANGALNGITGATDDATSNWLSSYSDFYSDVGDGYAGVMRGIARTIDAITGLLLGVGVAIARTFGGLPAIFREIFNRVYNSVVERIEAIVNATISGMNRLRSLVGKDPIELINLERKEVNEKAFEEYGKNMGKSFDDAFGAMIEGGFEQRLNRTFERAQRLSQERLAKMGGEADLTQGGPAPGAVTDPKELKKQQRELESLQKQFQSLPNTISPIEAAQLSLAEAQDTLNKALQAGIITTQQHEAYLAKLEDHYVDILDPLGKLNRELDEQTKLLGLNSKEREIEAQLVAHTQQLQKAGIDLTVEETNLLRDKLTALQDLNRVVQEQDSLLAGSVGEREKFVDQLRAIQNLLADSGSGFTQGDATNALASMNPDLFANTQEMFDAQAERFRTMYDQVAKMREADLISEETAAAMRVRIWAMQQEQQLQVAGDFFGNLAQLQKSENGKLAAIGKAAAIAQAVINTYQSATAAFSAMAGIPFVGPALGAAAAAAAVAAGMSNVARIRSQPVGFMTGGSFTVGGSGGADSQMVSFRATPGEQVAISTPTQVRKGNPKQEQLQENDRGVTINQVNNFHQPSDNRTDNQRMAAAARKQRMATSRLGG